MNGIYQVITLTHHMTGLFVKEGRFGVSSLPCVDVPRLCGGTRVRESPVVRPRPQRARR